MIPSTTGTSYDGSGIMGGRPAPTRTPAPNTNTPAVIAALESQFAQYGLSSLWVQVMNLINEGWDATNSEAFLVKLQTTDEYKQRFAANDARVKAGFSPLSPKEYVDTENAMMSVMADSGLMRPGFYNNRSDYQHLLEKNISPGEVQQRVTDAVTATQRADVATKQALQDYYGVGPDGIAAFFLDADKARPALEQQFAAANFKGLASQMGVGVDKSLSEMAAQNGIIGVGNDQQARAGLSQVAAESKSLAQLGSIYGDSISDAENVQATFNMGEKSADIDRRKKKLASQERASFGGSSALGNGSLTQKSAGQF
jgi:hypothetical protein